MAVRPLSVDTTGSINVVHDEAGHSGTLRLTDLRPGRNPDGTPDYRFTTMACPVAGCGAVSVHPASGGCDPENVQRLFVRLFMANPALKQARDWRSGKALLKRMVEEMDGVDRWCLEDATERDD